MRNRKHTPAHNPAPVSVRPAPVSLRPEVSVRAALELMDRHGTDRLAICTLMGIEIGAVHRCDLLQHADNPDAAVGLLRRF